MRNAVVAVLFWLLTLLVFSLPVFGQSDRGAIEGRVTDPSGAVLVGESVQAEDVQTGVVATAKTNTEGLFDFPVLHIGEYKVTVTAKGFKQFVETGIRLVSQDTVKLNIQLEVGDITQKVSVTGQATTVDTVTTSTGVTRTTEEMTELPLSVSNGRGRMVESIFRTMPGVNYGTSAYGEDLLVGYDTALNGANSAAETYEVDGASAATQFGTKSEENVGINPESVSELSIKTNPNAEYGSGGGNVVSIVTKSGTNKWHADAYGYYNSDKLNAADWFANATPGVPQHAKRGPTHEGEVGAAGGGPIIKDKLFVFGTWDRYHYRTVSAAAISTLPTAEMRQGNFTQLLGNQIGTDAFGNPVYQGEIYDPSTNQTVNGVLTRQPFGTTCNNPINVICQNELSSPSLILQKAIPVPNYGAANSIVNDFEAPTLAFGRDDDRETVKVDYYHGRQKLSGNMEIVTRFAQVGACVEPWEGQPGLPNIGCITFPPTNKRFGVSDAVSLSPNLLLEGSFSRNFWTYVVGLQGAGPTYGKTMGLQGLYSDAVPFIETQNYGFLGYVFGNQTSLTGTWNLATSLSWTKGTHSFKYGYTYEHNYSSNFANTFGTGFDNFTNAETGLPAFSGRTGWDYASLITGYMDSTTVEIPGSTALTRAVEWGFFAQDSWRATSKLTVNYGLRWDIGDPAGYCGESFASFDPNTANPATGTNGALDFYGPGATPRCNTINIYWHALGPRLGLAYQLGSKTVVRAYYGVTTENNSSGGLGYQATQTRAGALASTNGGLTAAYNWSTPFPASAIPPAASVSHNPSQANGSTVGWDVFNDNQAAKVQGVGLGVERQLPYGIIGKVDYVGKFIHGLPNTIQYDNTPFQYLSLGSLLNQPFNSTTQATLAGKGINVSPYTGFTGSVAQALRPYPQYLGISETSPSGWSTYNSLQITAQKHYGQGLTFLVAYTASKWLECDNLQGSYQLLQDTCKDMPMNGSSVTDRPQSLNISWIYELPFGKGKRFANQIQNPVLGRVVSGWQLAGLQNYFSGQPLVITGNATTTLIGSQWVNRVPGVPIIMTGCHSRQLENYNPSDPNAHLYLTPQANGSGAFQDPAPFTIGNFRNSSTARDCGVRMENLTLIKDTYTRENMKLRVGVDAFNIFNRHLWGPPNTNIDSPGYGSIQADSWSPREIQLFARFEF
jgi:hypothetical protein